jgi:hypothetical protein
LRILLRLLSLLLVVVIDAQWAHGRYSGRNVKFHSAITVGQDITLIFAEERDLTLLPHYHRGAQTAPSQMTKSSRMKLVAVISSLTQGR